MDREAIIRICIAEGVPIYQGKIDKHLFQAQLQAAGAAQRPRRANGLRSPSGPGRAGPLVIRLALRRSRLPSRLAVGPLVGGRLPSAELEVLAAATLALSASMRSTVGAGSASGSGTTIGSPLSGLEELAQVAPVAARELGRVEVGLQALDDLAREVELLRLQVVSSIASSICLRVDVLGEVERLEHDPGRAAGRGTATRAPTGRAARSRRRSTPPSPRGAAVCGRRCAGAAPGTRKYVRSIQIGSTSSSGTKRSMSIVRESSWRSAPRASSSTITNWPFATSHPLTISSGASSRSWVGTSASA